MRWQDNQLSQARLRFISGAGVAHLQQGKNSGKMRLTFVEALILARACCGGENQPKQHARILFLITE